MDVEWELPTGQDGEWDRVLITLTCNEDDCDDSDTETVDVRNPRDPTICQKDGKACCQEDGEAWTCSYRASGLRPSTGYAVTVQSGKGGAYSESSQPTEESTATTLSGAPQPPVISAAHPSLQQPRTSVMLGWTVPRDNGADIAGYFARYEAAGGGEGAVLLDDDGTVHTSGPVNASLSDDDLCKLVPTATASSVGSTLESELVGLQPGTTYDLSLFACNSEGASDGTAREATKSTHTNNVPDKPDPPSLGSGKTSTSVNIQWELPSGDCRGDPDGCVDDHDLPVTGSEFEFEGVATSYSAVTTTTSRDDLQPFTEHKVRVRFFNSLGASNWSDVDYLITAPDLPSKPDLDQNSCGEPVEGTTHLTLVKGTLVPNANAITKIEVETEQTAAGQSTAKVDAFLGTDLDETSLTLTRQGTGFIDYRDYSVSMRARNQLGWSEWSSPITCSRSPETDAEPPQNLEAVPLGPAVEVRWEMPSASTWDDFIVRLEPIPESSGGRRLLQGCTVEAPQPIEVDTGSISCSEVQGGRRLCEFNVTGGTPNTNYTVSVQSRTSQGTSSTPLQLPVVRTPPGPPQEPQCLSLADITDTSFRLGWLRPRDHGIAIAGFLVTYEGPGATATVGVGSGGESVTGADSCSAVANAPASSAGPEGGEVVTTLSGLQPGTSYAISILTCNADGDPSPDSAVLNASEVHTYAVPDKPAAPRIDTGEEVTPFSFTVRWEAPSSACRGDVRGCVDDHGLELTARELEVDGQVVDDVGGESYRATDLKPATSYEMRVRLRATREWRRLPQGLPAQLAPRLARGGAPVRVR